MGQCFRMGSLMGSYDENTLQGWLSGLVGWQIWSVSPWIDNGRSGGGGRPGLLAMFTPQHNRGGGRNHRKARKCDQCWRGHSKEECGWVVKEGEMGDWNQEIGGSRVQVSYTFTIIVE